MEDGVFNDEMAKESILKIIEQFKDYGDETDRPVTTRMRQILKQGMPQNCFQQLEGDSERFVPAKILDFAASNIFGDRWSTEILHQEIIKDDKDHIKLTKTSNRGKNNLPPEKIVHRVIAQARVRITVTAPNGSKQSHDGQGVGSYDIEWGSSEIYKLYKIALKGAVTDARKSAFSHFGRFLNPTAETDPALFIPASSKLEVGRPRVANTKRKVALELKDETGLVLETYELDQLGSIDWLNGYSEMLLNVDSPDALEKLRANNSLNLNRVEEKFSAELKDMLDNVKDILKNADFEIFGMTDTNTKENVENVKVEEKAQEIEQVKEVALEIPRDPQKLLTLVKSQMTGSPNKESARVILDNYLPHLKGKVAPKDIMALGQLLASLKAA